MFTVLFPAHSGADDISWMVMVSLYFTLCILDTHTWFYRPELCPHPHRHWHHVHQYQRHVHCPDQGLPHKTVTKHNFHLLPNYSCCLDKGDFSGSPNNILPMIHNSVGCPQISPRRSQLESKQNTQWWYWDLGFLSRNPYSLDQCIWHNNDCHHKIWNTELMTDWLS